MARGCASVVIKYDKNARKNLFGIFRALIMNCQL